MKQNKKFYMNNQIKQQLNKFFSMIASPQDLGLVIVEAKAAYPDKNFWRELDKDILYHTIDSPKSTGELKEKVVQAQRENKRLVIDIKVDPYPMAISLLKEISQFGELHVKNAEGHTTERIAIKPGSIIVVAERDFIEKEITYSNFYNLFDSAFLLS